MVPDYLSIQSVTANFIAPKNGYIQCIMTVNSQGDFLLYINNISVLRFTTSGGYRHSGNFLAPIGKGQIITSSNFAALKYIPSL